MNYLDLKRDLEMRKQTQILRFWEELSEEDRKSLLRQIGNVDWADLDLSQRGERARSGEISPITVLSAHEIACKRKEFSLLGREAVSAGKVGAVLLAGGQGTRLGFSAPKGAFDIGLTRPCYIFQRHIEDLLGVCRECGVLVPLFIMTSEKNDSETRSFFEEHGYFGYPREFIRFFMQDMSPSIDFSGKLLLEEKGRLALSPNGNGGWYSSLVRAGYLEEFPALEWLNVFSVDNVLQKIADPVFVGATIASGMNSGAKGVRKAYPEEKVGILCLQEGVPSVVEYYELDEAHANARGEDGELLYSFGVILNYLFRLEKLREIAEKKIPVHVVKKKVAYLDDKGELVLPERENAYKFETLILDMVRLMGNCLPFEVVREQEFAPVKNKTGVDSVDTARELLRANGVIL